MNPNLKKKLRALIDQQEQINKEMEQLLNEDIQEDKTLTAAELAKICNVQRSCVSGWLKRKIIINFEQNGDYCKISIPYAEISKAMDGPLSKYKNYWINFLQ